jgi:hypothetical protein
MFTSLQYKCVNKQTNKHAESESEVFSKCESADFREVRGLGLGRPKSSDKKLLTFLVCKTEKIGKKFKVRNFQGNLPGKNGFKGVGCKAHAHALLHPGLMPMHVRTLKIAFWIFNRNRFFYNFKNAFTAHCALKSG